MQTTILASGQTAGVSSDIVVGEGATVTIGLFASAKIPARTDIIPRIQVSSANNMVAKFSYRLIKTQS